MNDDQIEELWTQALVESLKDKATSARHRFAELIRSAVKEEDAKICEEQMARSREESEASKRIQEQHVYHHCAVTAEWNAAAIRASK